MLKKIGFSGAVMMTALGLMQTSAFAAERDGNRDSRDGYLQNDRNWHDGDQRRGFYRDDRVVIRDHDAWGDRFEFRFGFEGDRR